MGEQDIEQGESTVTERRVSVEEAAVLLGISKDAVRARIRHGALHSEETDGRMIRVWLGEDPASDRDTVRSRPRVEASPRATAEDIEELRAQVRHLREILAAERGVTGREDRIIAQLTRANASLAPVVPEPGTPAPPVRPEPVEPAEAKTPQPQRAEPERRGPGREARKGARSARSKRSANRAPGGGDGSAAEGGEVGAGSRESHRRTKAASRKSRLERRLESLKRRQRSPEPISALKLLTTEEIRRALVLTDRARVLPNGDVRSPEAFQEASPEELEAFSHWRKLCGEPLDHVELAEELLDRMGEAHSWRSPEALNAAQFLQRLERPDRSPWFVAKMAEAVLNFYAEMGQHPDEPQHPRVRGAVRRLERLKEIGLRDRTEPPEDSETAGGPAP